MDEDVVTYYEFNQAEDSLIFDFYNQENEINNKISLCHHTIDGKKYIDLFCILKDIIEISKINDFTKITKLKINIHYPFDDALYFGKSQSKQNYLFFANVSNVYIHSFDSVYFFDISNIIVDLIFISIVKGYILLSGKVKKINLSLCSTIEMYNSVKFSGIMTFLILDKLVFSNNNKALTIYYDKNIYKNGILSIVNGDMTFNISNYTLSKIKYGLMHFYYCKQTNRLYLQYHESRGMTIRCTFLDRNCKYTPNANYDNKVCKLSNDSTIESKTLGGIYNSSIKYTDSLIGDQIISFVDRNVIISACFNNSYFYSSVCKIEENINDCTLTYTCKIYDYKHMTDDCKDYSEYVYYNVAINSKQSLLSDSDYYNNLPEDISVNHEELTVNKITINKIFNNRMTVISDGVFIFSDNNNNVNNENITNINVNTFVNEDVFVNYIDETQINITDLLLALINTNEYKNIEDSSNDTSLSNYDYTFLIPFKDTLDSINIKLFEFCKFISFVNSSNSENIINSEMYCTVKNNYKIISDYIESNVSIEENDLFIKKFDSSGYTNENIIRFIISLYNTDKLPSDIVKDLASDTDITIIPKKQGFIVNQSEIGKRRSTKNKYYEFEADVSNKTKSATNCSLIERSQTTYLTKNNSSKCLLFAGTTIVDSIKTSTYGTLDVYVSTTETSKIKLIEKEDSEYDTTETRITLENIRITTPENQELEIILPDTVSKTPIIKQIELFSGKVKFSGSSVSQLENINFMLYKDVNPSDVISGINLNKVKIIKIGNNIADKQNKEDLLKRYKSLILAMYLMDNNSEEYKLLLLTLIKLKKEIVD